jgi:hypothetical protein
MIVIKLIGLKGLLSYNLWILNKSIMTTMNKCEILGTSIWKSMDMIKLIGTF